MQTDTPTGHRFRAIAPLLAGLSGGAISTVALYPLDLIKVRLQVNEDVASTSAGAKHRRLTFVQACRGVLRHEGVLGFYQGLTPAVVGSAVSWGGYFFVYEGLKRRYAEKKYPGTRNTQHLKPAENFVLAVVSGAVLVGLTNPVWLIKTRIQLQMTKTAREHNIKPYDGMLDAARTILREEGVSGLYKGAGPALMLTSHGGVQFVAYEFLKKYFSYTRVKRSDEDLSLSDRFRKSLGYLTIGGISKM